MNFDAISDNLPFFLLIIGLILLQFFLRRRGKPEATYRDIVQNLLTEVKLNQALVETFSLRQKPKKFEITSWQLAKNKLDFLDHPLQISLTDAFTIIQDFNQQIEATKKHKSASYMANVDADKLKEPLSKSKQGLEEWLKSKIAKKDTPAKRPGIFDDWFGRRN